MRKIIFILSFFAFLAVSCGKSRKMHAKTINTPTTTIEEFTGEWRSEYVMNPEDLTEDFINSSFELRLEKDDTKENFLIGWHCSIVRGGRKTDFAQYDGEPSIHGYLKNDTVYLHFVSSWEVEGEAKLYFDKSTRNQSAIIWELGKIKSMRQDGQGTEHYMPQADTLQRVIDKDQMGPQVILPDQSIPVNKERVTQIQEMVAEIDAAPFKCDTLLYMPLEIYGPSELFEGILFDNKGRVRKYFSSSNCHDGAGDGGTTSAYYNEKGELVYIYYESSNNCESATETYYVHKNEIVDFMAELYCDCCENTNDLLTEEEVKSRRPKIGSVLEKTIAREVSLKGFINTHALLAMLKSEERLGAYWLYEHEGIDMTGPDE